MAKQPKAYTQARQAEILEAAKRCFARAGYRRTSMNDVASEADLSVGALYRYFSGKEALFRALTKHSLEETTAYFGESETDQPYAQLTRFIGEFFERIATQDGRRILTLDLRFQAEALDSAILHRAVGRAVKHQTHIFSQLIAGAKGRSVVDPSSAAQAYALISLMRGAGQHLLEHSNFDVKRQMELILATIDCWIKHDN